MKTVQLTRETAVKLIQRTISIPEWMIVGPCEPGYNDVIFFTAKPGNSLDLKIVCENDGYERNGRIKLTISDRRSEGCIVMYFDPDTLERDLEAEKRLASGRKKSSRPGSGKRGEQHRIYR